MIKLIVMKIISKFFNAYLAMNYRKRLILNGIISSILNGAMLAVSWYFEALPSIIIFSIFALVLLVTTFYFIIKKDVKKPDRDRNGKTLLEVLKPFYSNKTNRLIYPVSLVINLLVLAAVFYAGSLRASVIVTLIFGIQLIVPILWVVVNLYRE